MSFAYGGYNPKAPNGTGSASQAAASGRKFAVMPKLGGLGGVGLGYSKPKPAPAPAPTQAPIAPAAAPPAAGDSSPEDSADTVPTVPPTMSTVVEKQSPSPPQLLQQQSQQRPVMQQQQQQPRPVQQVQLQQPKQPYYNSYGAVPRSAAGANRPPVRAAIPVMMPVMRAAGGLGYAAQLRPQQQGLQQQQRPTAAAAAARTSLGYGAGSSYGSELSLNVPLREPTPEPDLAPIVAAVIKEEYRIEDDYRVYGTVDDIEIMVRNVVCNYTLPLHIDLRKLAHNSNNVTFDRGRGVLLQQLRYPNCYVKIYSSGKVYIVGCKSEDECKTAARRIARGVQRAMHKLGEEVRIRNYRVCNVLATCKMPFGVKVEEVAVAYPSESQYEPELSVGLVWRNKEPKATLRIHTTGSVTVTGAQSEVDVFTVIARLYPILLKYKCPPRAKGELTEAQRRKKEAAAARKRSAAHFDYDGPRSKIGRGGGGGEFSGGVVGGRVVFSDEEDEDDIYDPAFYDDE